MNDGNKQLKDYLKGLFTNFQPYNITDDDRKIIQKSHVNFIVQKLLRKKFRKQHLHPETIKEFTDKITNKLKENKPIHFTIPFGGYKHFWNTSYPEPDWAEVFTLKFLTDWVMPILVSYKPGVIIDFISEDIILPRMNNYPDDALEKYSQIFSSLLDIYKKSLPKNFIINFFRVGDKCNKKNFIQKVENLLPERWEKWTTYTSQQKDIELKRSRRSVMWKGKDDLTTLSQRDKDKRIIESRLIELAYYDVEADPEVLGDYLTGDNRIGICFSFGLSPDNATHWIALGSTYASVVDFWIGRGILEKTSNGFMPRIVSGGQYQKIKDSLQIYQLEFNCLPSKNYQIIEAISSEDWNNRF